MTLPSTITAAPYTENELEESLRPIGSLISKSEKAQKKLKLGTWQHMTLEENLRALRIAAALMSPTAIDAAPASQNDLREALRAIASMIERTEKALAMFSPGMSQHTLQRNRLKALRIAEALVRKAAGR